MFMVSEEAAAAVQAAYQKSGEWGAVAELRWHFPVITGKEMQGVRKHQLHERRTVS